MEAKTAACALTAICAIGCSLPEGDYFGKVADSPDPTTLRFCNSGEPEFVDPALLTSTTGSPLARLMFAGLAEFGTDMEGTPIPALAKSWDASPDQRTFTFHLRDDAVWSNGRPITSADFVFGMTRILHPKSLSRNVEPLKPIKNAGKFSAGRVKRLTADHGPFRRGDIVEVVSLNEKDITQENKEKTPPNSNIRTSSKKLGLRDLPGSDGAKPDSYRFVPAGEELDIVELSADAQWAYVYWDGDGEWVYGWVPMADLDGQPNAKVSYLVREIGPENRPGITLAADPTLALRSADVPGEKLLMTPEVLGIRAPDPHTFVIEAWGPTPYLMGEIQGRVYRPTPRESVSRSPKKWTKPSEGLLVTSGAFTMTEWRERDKMVFKKSPSFYDADKVRLSTFISYSMNDQAASTNLYYQGGCDVVTANNIPYSYLPALTGAKRGRPYEDFALVPYLGIYYYVINTKKFPNRHLRRALSHGVDRSPIPRLINGGELPTSSFVPGRPVSSLSDEELAKCKLERDAKGVVMFVTPEHCYHSAVGPDFDVEEAMKELAIAKKEMGDTFPKDIELKFNSGNEQHKIIAEYVQDQWQRHLGIKVTLRVQEWKTYLKDTTAGNFQIGRLGWIGSSPEPEAQFLIVFKCQGGKPTPYNRSQWCNEDYDRLYKEAGQETNRTKRLALLREADEIMINDQPIIPLYVYTQKHLRKPYVKDMGFQLGDQLAMWRAWIDVDWKKNLASESTPAAKVTN